MHRHHRHAETRVAVDVDGIQEIDALTSAHLTAEAVGWGMPHRWPRAS